MSGCGEVDGTAHHKRTVSTNELTASNLRKDRRLPQHRRHRDLYMSVAVGEASQVSERIEVLPGFVHSVDETQVHIPLSPLGLGRALQSLLLELHVVMVFRCCTPSHLPHDDELAELGKITQGPNSNLHKGVASHVCLLLFDLPILLLVSSRVYSCVIILTIDSCREAGRLEKRCNNPDSHFLMIAQTIGSTSSSLPTWRGHTFSVNPGPKATSKTPRADVLPETLMCQ